MFNKLKKLILKTDRIKKFPWFLGKNAFWIIILLVFIESSAGELLFYKYAISVERNEPKIIDYNIKFRKNIYQKVLEKWQEKAEKFEEYQIEQYSDFFVATKAKEEDKLINLENLKANSPVIK